MTEIIPAAPQATSEITYDLLIESWMNNFATNLPKMRDPDSLSLTDLPKYSGKPVIIIGAGPSLRHYNHLGMIQRAKWNHPVFVCDRMLTSTIAHGIAPEIVATVDSNVKIAQFYKTSIPPSTKAAFAISVHPDVVKAFHGDIYWWVPILDHPQFSDGRLNKKSVSYILHLISGNKAMISGVGNVGSFLWNLAAELECSPIILVGFDFSEQVKDKAKAIYFEHYTSLFFNDLYKKLNIPVGSKLTRANKQEIRKIVRTAREKAAVIHQVEENPDFHTFYLVNSIWKRYRELLKDHIVSSGIETINCTGNGCLHTQAINVPNFKAMPLQEILEKYK